MLLSEIDFIFMLNEAKKMLKDFDYNQANPLMPKKEEMEKLTEAIYNDFLEKFYLDEKFIENLIEENVSYYISVIAMTIINHRN